MVLLFNLNTMNTTNNYSSYKNQYSSTNPYGFRNNLGQQKSILNQIKYSKSPKNMEQKNQNNFVQIPLQMILNKKKGLNSINKIIDIDLNINLNDLELNGEKPSIKIKLKNQQLQSNNIQLQKLSNNIQVDNQKNLYIPNSYNIQMVRNQKSNVQKINMNIIPNREEYLKKSTVNQLSELLDKSDLNIDQKNIIPQVNKTLTCVICKQKYEIDDIQSHAEKHKKHHQHKIKNKKISYICMNKQLKPNYRPVLQPQECVMNIPQNLHVVKKVNRNMMNSQLNKYSEQNKKSIKSEVIKLKKVSFQPVSQIPNILTFRQNPKQSQLVRSNQNKIKQQQKLIDEINVNQIKINQENLIIGQKSRNRVSKNLKINLGKSKNGS